mmetsp:Transcript_26954/g.39911  ORF Transcript_26954/g.39911 Transcript_26954/m.39911 type:complete len:346 (+) Transcript_26954:1811-2848(+)
MLLLSCGAIPLIKSWIRLMYLRLSTSSDMTRDSFVTPISSSTSGIFDSRPAPRSMALNDIVVFSNRVSNWVVLAPTYPSSIVNGIAGFSSNSSFTFTFTSSSITASSTSLVIISSPLSSQNFPNPSTKPVKYSTSPAFTTNSCPTALCTLPVAARCTLTKYTPSVSRNPDLCTVRFTAGLHFVNRAPSKMLLSLSIGTSASSLDPPINFVVPGTKNIEKTKTYAIPAMATGTPYFPRSNNPTSPTASPGYRACNKPTTTRFVDVPINVQVPPRMDAKLNGISNCCGLTPIFFPHRCTIGIMTTTTGVLLRKALTMAIGSMSLSCAPAALLGRPSIFPMYQSRAPV